MSGVWTTLRAAFGYFSVLPVGAAGPPEPALLALLPLVGATIGAAAGGGGALAARALPPPLPAGCAVALQIALSGALHLDGFLDGCDACFASAPPARRLDILADPRHGTFALAGLAVVGALWYGAVTVVAPARLPGTLAFSGALARTAALVNAYRFSDVRSAAGNPALGGRPDARVLGATGVLLLAAAARGGRGHLALVPGALAAALACGDWCARQLGGGLVGDAYGFTIVIVEAVTLVGLAALEPAAGRSGEGG